MGILSLILTLLAPLAVYSVPCSPTGAGDQWSIHVTYGNPGDQPCTFNNPCSLDTAILCLHNENPPSARDYTVYLHYHATNNIEIDYLNIAAGDQDKVRYFSVSYNQQAPGNVIQNVNLLMHANIRKVMFKAYEKIGGSGSAITDINKKVTIDYVNANFNWVVGGAMTVEWHYVKFTSTGLYNNCNNDKCKHCHNSDAIYDSKTGTGIALGTNETGLEIWLNGSMNTQNCKLKGGKEVEKTGPNLAMYWFLSVSHKDAKLVIKNSSFEDIRYRPNSVIHIFLGAVELDNVNFKNVEPGKNPPDGTYDQNQGQFQPRGIITSSAKTDLTTQGPDIVTIFACVYHTSSQTKAPSNSGDCVSTFTWTTGTVENLNYDVSLFDRGENSKSVYHGFMDLRTISTVTMTDVTFKNNLVPYDSQGKLNTTDGQTHAIVNISYVSQVNWTRVKFENNAADKGAAYIYFDRQYITFDMVGGPPTNYVLVNNETHLTLDDCTFTRNTALMSSVGTTYASGLTVDAAAPVNIEIKNSNFSKNVSHKSSFGALKITSNEHDMTESQIGQTCVNPNAPANDPTGCGSHEYLDNSQRNRRYSYTPFFLKITDTNFTDNWGQIGSGLYIEKWVNVSLKGLVFDRNKEYQYSVACGLTDTYTVIKHFLDTHVDNNNKPFIQSRALSDPPGGPRVEAANNCDTYGSGLQIGSQKKCSKGALVIQTVVGLSIEGGTTNTRTQVKNGNCNFGPNSYITGVSGSLTITNSDWSDNGASGSSGAGLALSHSISFSKKVGETDFNTVPHISSCTFTNNILTETPVDSGGGGIHGLTASGSSTDRQRLRLTTVTFTGNSGTQGGGVFWEGGGLYITGCTFTSNKAKSTDTDKGGGAIYFQTTLDSKIGNAELPVFSITGSTFTTNTSNYGGDIQTTDGIEDTGSYTQVLISGTTFTGSSVPIAGSGEAGVTGSIRLGTHAFKQPSDANASKITGCTFKTIQSTSEGAIRAAQSIGTLEISSTTFDGLTSTSYACVLHGNYASDGGAGNECYVKFETVTIKNCNCGHAIFLFTQTLKMVVKAVSITVTDNQFTFMYQAKGSFSDTNGTYTKNKAVNPTKGNGYGTVYYGRDAAAATFTGSTFTENEASMYGGVIYLAEATTNATFNTIKATGNKAHKGGFLYSQDMATYICQYCTVTSNEVTDLTLTDNTKQYGKGSAFFILSSNQDGKISKIENSTITDNTGDGVIYLLEANYKILKSTLKSNKLTLGHTAGTPGVVLILSDCESEGNTFDTSITGYFGGFINASSNSVFHDKDSKFNASSTYRSGGVGYAVQSILSFKGSTITDSYAPIGGMFTIINSSEITLDTCTLSNARAVDRGPAVIKSNGSKITITSTTISTFDTTAIRAESSSLEFGITGSTFKDGGHQANTIGGVLSLSDAQQLIVNQSIFENVKATEGGAFYFSDLNSYTYTVTNSTFTNCTAVIGGAIHNVGHILKLDTSYFHNNTAEKPTGVISTQYEDGGAIYTYCSGETESCAATNFLNNTFCGNKAVHDGGAIKWVGAEPVNVLNNTFCTNNTAAYGPDIAAVAEQLQIASSSSTATSTTRRLATDGTSAALTEVASGQKGDLKLDIAILDRYGNIVATDSSSKGTLVSTEGASSTGNPTTPAASGFYNFSDFGIIAWPGNSTSIRVESSAIAQKGDTTNNQIEIAVEMRHCISGEIISGDPDVPDKNVQCTECSGGNYAIEVNATACLACKSYFQCTGGNKIWPDPGYWRSNNETDTFFECPRYESCLGHEDQTSSTGACEEGYEGNLCQSCTKDFSRVSKDTCQKCPDEAVNATRLSGIMLLVICIAAFMVRSTLLSAHKPKEIYSVYFKIFMNYMQLVVLMASFNLNWPAEVQALLDTQESAGSVTEQVFSFDCYLEDANPDVEVFFQKLIIVLFLPVIMTTIAFFVWVPVALKQHNLKPMKNQLVTTIIVLFFLVHPVVVKVMFSSFSCMEIEAGEQWLMQDMDIRCWKGDHLQYTLFVALIGVLLWGCGAPALALIMLAKSRKTLDTVETKSKFGFLYIGYRKKTFFWEFVILYRKICVVFISVFLVQFNVEVQALTAMLVLILSFFIQEHYEPYDTDELNSLEKKSILCSAVTIFCGLYFLTNSLSNLVKLVFFFIILGANLYFIFYWLKGMIVSIADKGARVKPWLFRKLCRCWPQVWRRSNNVVRDQIEEELRVVEMDPMFRPKLDPDLEEVTEDIGYYKLVMNRRAGRTSDNKVQELDQTVDEDFLILKD